MKIRKGFVTNSSSSSFILGFKSEESIKEELQKENLEEEYFEESKVFFYNCKLLEFPADCRSTENGSTGIVKRTDKELCLVLVDFQYILVVSFL